MTLFHDNQVLLLLDQSQYSELNRNRASNQSCATQYGVTPRTRYWEKPKSHIG